MNKIRLKELSIPVTERLPKVGIMTLLISESNFELGFITNNKIWRDENGEPIDYNITHWLDINELTLKSRAEELARGAFEEGRTYEDYIQNGFSENHPQNINDFIAQNKSKL